MIYTSASAIAISVFETHKREEIIKLFFQKNALSQDTAKDFSDQDFAQISKTTSQTSVKDLYRYKFFIRIPGTNRWFLDK